jgi:hypothetical protein
MLAERITGRQVRISVLATLCGDDLATTLMLIILAPLNHALNAMLRCSFTLILSQRRLYYTMTAEIADHTLFGRAP